MKTLLLSLLFSTSVLAAPDATWTLQTGAPWQVNGSVKANQDLSAVDSLDGKTGFLASDEGSALQSVTFDAAAKTLTVGDTFKLLGKKQEADIEGIAAAPAENCYYVTGSHAISRKKMEYEASRFHLFRVKVDAATGNLSGGTQVGSLRDIMAGVPELKAFLDQPASGNGIDIEGLAWRDGRLFVGFRAPVGGANAWVLETTGAAVFDGAPLKPTLHVLPLGSGMGIRAMATVPEGFFLLTGDSGGPQISGVPELFFWAPGAAAVKLGTVPTAGAKPEALMVLSQSPEAVELLMISDGLTNGNPVTLKVSKTTAQEPS